MYALKRDTVSPPTVSTVIISSYLEISARPGSQPLLDLSNLQQLVSFHQPTQFAYQSDMFAHIATKLAEFGVFFDKSFHVADRVDRGGVVREGVGLVGLDV